LKYELIIDKEKEESIIIRAHEKTELINQIEELLKMSECKVIGYYEDEIIPVNFNEVFAIYTRDSKVYINVNNKDYLIKERLYQIEEMLDTSFVKINQGCIVNIKKILKFENSITGSIKVILKNGFSDYISRRELKNVKRRIGL
jgi:DNA-binding LytR/AlgR family response regulator